MRHPLFLSEYTSRPVHHLGRPQRLDQGARVPPIGQIPVVRVGRQDDPRLGAFDGAMHEDDRGALAFYHLSRVGPARATRPRREGYGRGRGRGVRQAHERARDGQRRPDGVHLDALTPGRCTTSYVTSILPVELLSRIFIVGLLWTATLLIWVSVHYKISHPCPLSI